MLSKANLACLVSLRANTFYNFPIYLSYCTIDVIILNKSVLLLVVITALPNWIEGRDISFQMAFPTMTLSQLFLI